jgi:sodium/glucose cotransporter 9
MKGAFYGLMIGLVCGLIRLIWEFSYSIPGCGDEDKRPAIIKINYLYFAIILWVICTLSTVTISLLTKPGDPERVIYLLLFENILIDTHNY